MTDVTTIARPYANAIFELALEENKLKEWSDVLKLLATIANDKNMQSVLKNPLIAKDDLVKLFHDITGDLPQKAINLINELASKKRLNILPAISKVYEVCLAERERVIDVKVVSAFPIDEARLKKLQVALQGYLNRQVNIKFAIDRELIGGVVIHAGNKVINGSLRGKLDRLSERLCS